MSDRLLAAVRRWAARDGDPDAELLRRFAADRDEATVPVARTRPPDRIGPVVPALLCPDGHVNPPSGTACRSTSTCTSPASWAASRPT